MRATYTPVHGIHQARALIGIYLRPPACCTIVCVSHIATNLLLSVVGCCSVSWLRKQHEHSLQQSFQQYCNKRTLADCMPRPSSDDAHSEI